MAQANEAREMKDRAPEHRMTRGEVVYLLRELWPSRANGEFGQNLRSDRHEFLCMALEGLPDDRLFRLDSTTLLRRPVKVPKDCAEDDEDGMLCYEDYYDGDWFASTGSWQAVLDKRKAGGRFDDAADFEKFTILALRVGYRMRERLKLSLDVLLSAQDMFMKLITTTDDGVFIGMVQDLVLIMLTCMVYWVKMTTSDVDAHARASNHAFPLFQSRAIDSEALVEIEGFFPFGQSKEAIFPWKTWKDARQRAFRGFDTTEADRILSKMCTIGPHTVNPRAVLDRLVLPANKRIEALDAESDPVIKPFALEAH